MESAIQDILRVIPYSQNFANKYYLITGRERSWRSSWIRNRRRDCAACVHLATTDDGQVRCDRGNLVSRDG
jgi:hypothetical protein